MGKTQTDVRRSRRGQGGFTIIAVLILAILVGGISSAFVILALGEARSAESWRYKMKATYLAEAGCEESAAQIRRLKANYTRVPFAPATVTISSADADFEFWKDASDVLHGTGTLRLNGLVISCTIDEIGQPRRMPLGLGYRHLQAYAITAQTRMHDSLGRVVRTVDLAEDPLPGFLAFYNSDLEIQPGPSATFTGRIHTNANLHVGTESGSTLRFNSSFIHAQGEIHRHRKENPQRFMPGTVEATVSGTGNYLEWDASLESHESDWAEKAEDWDGTLQAHATPIEAPEVGSIQPGGHFEQTAGLVIKDGAAYSDGSPVTLPAGAITSETVYDAREGRNVPVTTIDIGLLNGSPYFPDNGILYAYHSTNSTGSLKGIKIKNGALLSAPLTTVSNAPVYIQGNYNTGGNPPNPARKQPSMVVADAVNLLSNSWDGTKRAGGTVPAASATTYNLAVVTGNLETTPSNYNGGMENLVRFHENWSGRKCTIRGSFINLWKSQLATGTWGKSGVYSPPNRDWDFETMFDDPDSQPPGSLSGWSVARTTYQEDYP